MKKKIIGLMICIIMISTIPFSTATSIDATPLDLKSQEEPTSIFGVTFIAGYVLNLEQTVLGRMNANAIVLLYYDRGIIQKDSGVLTGLQKVSFRNTSLLFINEQGPMGLARVFGVCTGFVIGM